MPRTMLDPARSAPAALLVDLPVVVALVAVSRLSLSESYALPPVGATAFRTTTTASTDTISLSALLVGSAGERLAQRKQLELIAASSRRGGTLGAFTGGALTGVVFVSALVTRTNIQVADLSFSVSPQRIGATEVSMTLRHVPRPGPVDLLVDVAGSAAMSGGEFLP